MKKFILIVLLLICSVYSHALPQKVIKSTTTVDERIYDKIRIILTEKYKNDDDVNCMDEYFRRNKIAENFYSPDLLIDDAKLAKEIDPYIIEAISSCSGIPIFVIIIIAIFLTFACIIFGCCIIYYMYYIYKFLTKPTVVLVY